MYAKEIRGGNWYGVRLPMWLRAFDCRADDLNVAPKTPWGATLWGGERAEVDLGLRGISSSGERFYHATTPISTHTYLDAREATEAQLAEQVVDMVQKATTLRQEWVEAVRYPSNGQGGSVFYLPVACEMSNYGYGIICDRRTGRVRRFGWNAGV